MRRPIARWVAALGGALGGAFAAVFGGCSTCPTGACPPVCWVVREVVVPQAVPAGVNVVAFDGTDVVVAFRDASGELRVAHISAEAALREAPVSLGARDGELALFAGPDATGLLVGAPAGGGIAYLPLDGRGLPLDEIALEFTDYEGQKPIAAAATPTGFVVVTNRAGVGSAGETLGLKLAAYDAEGALVAGPSETEHEVDRVRIAVGSDGAMTIVGATGAAAVRLDAGSSLVVTGGASADGGEVADGVDVAVTTGGERFVVASRASGVLTGTGLGADVVLATGAAMGLPRVETSGPGRLVVVWREPDMGAFMLGLGPDGTPRGREEALPVAVTHYDLVPTPRGVALLYAPLPATGEADVDVAFVECQ